MNMLGPQGNRPSTGGAALGAGVGSLTGSLTGTGGALTPPGTRTGQTQQPTLTARTSDGSSLPTGSVLRGQVTGQDQSGNYSLQLGDRTLTARSAQPLEIGQALQLRVQGEDDGQLTLQLVKSPFTQLDRNDLATNLNAMRIPPSDANLELAQNMVELGIPLTKENFSEMLSQTALPEGTTNPPPMQARVAAVVFMEQNQIPVTPQNMVALSQFMADNPQLGQQMFALNGELRKLSKTLDGKAVSLLKDLPEMMEEEGILGLNPNPKAEQKKAESPKQQLFNMAKQLGIEANLTPYGGGEDPWELLAELKRFRAESEGVVNEKDMSHFLELLGKLETNVEAQRLINQAHPEQLFGFFYLQFPLFGANNVEVWIRYRSEENGGKTVESDDCALEFLVTTENLGELFFVVDIQGDLIDLSVGVESEDVREFVSRYLPLLQERIEQQDWVAGNFTCSVRGSEKRELVEHTDFSRLESCNVQA